MFLDFVTIFVDFLAKSWFVSSLRVRDRTEVRKGDGGHFERRKALSGWEQTLNFIFDRRFKHMVRPYTGWYKSIAMFICGRNFLGLTNRRHRRDFRGAHEGHTSSYWNFVTPKGTLEGLDKVFFSDEAWFYLSGHFNRQNFRIRRYTAFLTERAQNSSW